MQSQQCVHKLREGTVVRIHHMTALCIFCLAMRHEDTALRPADRDSEACFKQGFNLTNPFAPPLSFSRIFPWNPRQKLSLCLSRKIKVATTTEESNHSW